MGVKIRLRYVDVQIAEPRWAQTNEVGEPITAEVDLEDGETIAAIEHWWKYGGPMNDEATLMARVWIGSTWE